MVENAIRPSWVPLHLKGGIVVGLPLESRCESNITLFEESWHVVKLPLYVELVTVDENVIAVLLHRLYDRGLKSVDAVVQVTH